MPAAGATTVMEVSASCVGAFLHRLEYAADVHLLGRSPDPGRELERWTLRSDRFPAAWEGREVLGWARSDAAAGVEFELIGAAP